ncbi:MAG: ATP-binding protein [Oligoflexales bacterium]
MPAVQRAWEQEKAARLQLEATREAFEQQTQILQEQKEALRLRDEELVAVKENLEKKVDEHEANSKYKSQFLANISHELRTPLNSILIMSSLLKDFGNALTSEQKEYTETITKAGHDLLELINDILDVSKFEAGKLEVAPRYFELDEMLDKISSVVSPLAEAKGLEFKIFVDPSTPSSIYTDKLRVEQIIKNFLSNAIKFTLKGRVEFVVQPAKQRVDRIAFSVLDTGIGIPKDKIEKIFEAFTQLENSAKKYHGGTGLGLAISKKLAHLLGGDIEVKPNPGGGSIFTFYLPSKHEGDSLTISSVQDGRIDPVKTSEMRTDEARRPEARDAIPGAKRCTLLASATLLKNSLPNPPVFSGKRALLIDGDMRHAFILAGALESLQMDVDIVRSGKDALDTISSKRPNYYSIVLVNSDSLHGVIAECVDKLQSLSASGETFSTMILAEKSKDSENLPSGSIHIKMPIQMHELVSSLTLLWPVATRKREVLAQIGGNL